MMRPAFPGLRLPAWLVLMLALSMGGAAYAYWTGSGGGPGSSATGTALPLTLSPGTPTGDLYHGGQTDIVLTVSNPNAFDVLVDSLSLDPGQGTAGYAVDGGHSGCVVSMLSFTTQTNGGNGWTVPASGSLPVTLTSSLGMGAGAASACQGATFTVYLVADGATVGQ